jgi:hypothetical protein
MPMVAVIWGAAEARRNKMSEQRDAKLIERAKEFFIKLPHILEVVSLSPTRTESELEHYVRIAAAFAAEVQREDRAEIDRLKTKMEHDRQTHEVDIRRLESAIQLHVIMKEALHGNEKAEMSILELADMIRASKAAALRRGETNDR